MVLQLARRAPAALHVVDISENNLAELTRDFRSSIGYIEGDTRFLPLDPVSEHALDRIESGVARVRREVE